MDKAAVLDQLLKSGIPACGACRFSPDLVLSGVRSASRLPQGAFCVLTGLFPYYTGEYQERNLSLYSVIPDYHSVAGKMLDEACERLKKLFPENAFVPFVDASPIDEVTAAVRADLGVRGKNGQLITERFGSMVFIGEIVSDIKLELSDSPERGCEGCGACIAMCPTGALSKNGFDKALCRSHFSQKKGELTEWERAQLISGKMAWGCDICTLACPHNRSLEITPIEEFLLDTAPVADFENLSRLLKNRAFAWRGRAVLERNLSLLKQK